MILRASHVLTEHSGLVTPGAVRIERGSIVEVGSDSSLQQPQAIDLGDGLLLPGFVNAHTHLELSHLAGRVPPDRDFASWISRLTRALRADGNDETVVGEAVRRGRELSLTSGVTTVGDITRLPDITRPVLADGPLRVLSHGEVIAFGKLRGRLAERLQAAANDHWQTAFLRVGISPHSPYTLEPDGIRACVEQAKRAGLRTCMHLAETADEADFTTRQSGAIGAFLKRSGAWDRKVPCPGMKPVEYAVETGLLSGQTLLAHVNYVEASDIDLIAAAGCHVAYCPRTHAAFGHEAHPFQQMLSRGVSVCVGTDSLASNPSLSTLDELRFLRSQHPDLSADVLLEMGTIRGAAALGMEADVGSIAPGKQADLTFIPHDPQGPTDPRDNLLDGTTQPSATWVSGNLVCGAISSQR